MSEGRTSTRRRDNDPVRVYADGRIAWYTGGAPGVGKRKIKRCGNREAAELEATELRDHLRLLPSGAHSKLDQTIDDLMRAARDHWEAVGRPPGTIRQYRSNYNTHIPESVGAKLCHDADISTWTAIFDNLNRARASEQVVRSVARTMGALIQYGSSRGYFPDGQPFGGLDPRKAVVSGAKETAAHQSKARPKPVVHLLDCPTPADIDKFAAAFEEEYPGYGARLVWLAFGTGLRINEVLALRVDSIDLDTLVVAVDWQLDRYGNWPALVKPKGKDARTTQLWTCYRDVAVSLIEDARSREGIEYGWLFPRHRSETKWAEQAGKLSGAAIRRCEWQWSGFHWLRHGFASWSLAPASDGGFGMNPTRVQKWLGHKKLSTTTDFYVHTPRSNDAHIREATRHLPGTPTGR
ncbi:Phage integrase family protein [Klenkia soli]|uniref:Phage integrase family protein n=1 Tax=Klenkia soli TaxID=1052260 RepID=A0A1H0INR7_9ACTN|nr:site-specific integrase [Klenkia soli]SDO33013.1 Phage integrase family protein [Klenkia soli]